jgi:hypothetical protein
MGRKPLSSAAIVSDGEGFITEIGNLPMVKPKSSATNER